MKFPIVCNMIIYVLSFLLIVNATLSSAQSQINGLDQIKSVSSGDILYVGGGGPDNYSKIQDAINDANDGDTVFVYSKIYYERNIEVHKAITLMGEDRDTTVIDANDIGDVLILKENNTTIKGFTIRDADNHGAKCGIWVASSNNSRVLDCIIKGGDRGITISDGCNNNVVSHCDFRKNWEGVWIDGEDEYIFDNAVLHCNFDSGNDIQLSSAVNMVISDCTFYKCRIEQHGGSGTTIANCEIYNASGDGIQIWGCEKDLTVENLHYRRL